MRVGYEVIVVFVGDFHAQRLSNSTAEQNLAKRINLTHTFLLKIGAHVVNLPCNSSYAIKMSQIVRVFVGFLPTAIVQDNDYIITADSDLLPVKFSEYQPTTGTDGFIFNAFCCGNFKRRSKSYRMFPMGHIYLRKDVWRDLIVNSTQRSELLAMEQNRTFHLSLTNRTEDSYEKKLLSQYSNLTLLLQDFSFKFELMTLYMRHEFRSVYDQQMGKGDSAWYMDQVMVSMLLTDYRSKHPQLKISERGRIGRLDRISPMSYWDRDTFNEFGDAHLKHDEILQPENWKIFNKLLKFLFNYTLVDIMNDYYRQYIIITKTKK
ncbi:unnamed protein product [Didymodactylos carnosus]|uniref:Uncharacterized protein n=1 Tax=Didymodactylos carnosus TaxID=1234261 RepID=A0A815XN68_9BILA|nr:unnamed protein product [Didymodactylos carnosus]CAF1559908.1 unnamed protein product [Didymodactylos carnosus]CAF4264912.1 unnamed protein product [Didymodactylos carnosus]CAF4421329.1 unnamed protein product [Didymodactylos carnosus]